MTDAQLQNRLLTRLAFTLALGLPDDPAKLALAWPSVLENTLFWDARAALTLSPEGYEAAESAATEAHALLETRSGTDEPFTPVHPGLVPLFSAKPPMSDIPALTFMEA